jgi:chlorobactene glucosyltransferase
VNHLILIILILYAVGVASLVWSVVRTISLLRVQRAPVPPPQPRNAWPSLDVVVPVKDEAAHIAACLESILRQDYPGLRIIVVNDRSTDGTVHEVERVQRDHPQLLRVDIASLPEGLYGKPHALASLADRLQGDNLAFVDSDLLLDPRCLTTLVHHLESQRLDWIAGMGAPEIHQFWERLLVPILGAVSFAWYDPRKISDPAWPDAIGSALMLCRRSAYQSIGGHAAVIRAYDEDSELIRLAKRAGQRVSFLLIPELFRQRHYGAFARTVHGLTRTFVGGIKTLPRMLMTMQALCFISLAPWVVTGLALAAVLTDAAVPGRGAWLAVGLVHLLASSVLAGVVYRTAQTPPVYALLHPLGSAVTLGICARAALHLRRREPITWRGTTVPTIDGGDAA